MLGLCLLCLSLFVSFEPTFVCGWSGPKSSVSFTSPPSSAPRILIDGDSLLPAFFTITAHDSEEFFDTLSCQLKYASQSGIRIVSVLIPLSDLYPSLSNFTHKVFSSILSINPDFYLFPRINFPMSLSPPEWEMLLQNSNNASSKEIQSQFQSLTKEWISFSKQELKHILLALDTNYPGRFIGVHICDFRSEWFMYDDETPNHELYHDYNPVIEKEFCDQHCSSGEAAPSAQSRATPTLGNSLLDGSKPVGRLSALYNYFLGQLGANAIVELAHELKKVTGGNALMMVFFGYLFELGETRLPGSGHLALTELYLPSSPIDIIVSPYSYSPKSRFSSGSLIPMGPYDSSWMRSQDRLYCYEDDTRTVFCDDRQQYGDITTLKKTVGIMTRNLYTAIIHGNAIYYYDLPARGWFGKCNTPDLTTMTEELWKSMETAFLNAKLLALNTGTIVPQVAVFVDDKSAAHLRIHQYPNPDFGNQLLSGPREQLPFIGAPIRYYHLRDILDPSFDTHSIRFAIFLNAFVMPDEIEQAVSSRLLSKSNLIALFYYAVNIFETIGDPANWTRMASFLGDELHDVIQVVESPKFLSPLQSEFQLVPDSPIPQLNKLAGQVWGDVNLRKMTPYVYFRDVPPSVKVLGKYSLGVAKGKASFVSITTPKHPAQILFSSTPGFPSSAYSAIAQAANVFQFLDTDSIPDVFDAQGNALMIHSASEGSRIVSFPEPMIVELPPKGEIICRNCTSFSTPLLAQGDTILYLARKFLN